MDPTKDLSPREIQILKAIIEEYIATAEPVGSETLDKKYNLGVSPATIRNEMVRLTDLKMLNQPHTSSGRAPTPAALRYYVDHLMKPKDMSVADEVAVKDKMWEYRQEVDKLLREATKTLAEKTKTLAITATKDGDLYYSGAANLLDMPEFYDYELTHSLLSTLDQYGFWWELVDRDTDPFDILLGEEIAERSILNQCGFVFEKFTSPHVSGAIGIIGPSRLNYPMIIPYVRYVGNLIGEFTRSW
ncbi:MAG: Transcriptional regulator of heat shock protein [Microgenomates group bacterium GW2011_GWC1_49_7]|nr:MAG: Transcriptional regulator of heat shock protein [Microgenomates group bacterium GW2011_GWC1_49_7]